MITVYQLNKLPCTSLSWISRISRHYYETFVPWTCCSCPSQHFGNRGEKNDPTTLSYWSEPIFSWFQYNLMINMDASCGNSYFSIIRFQIRVALLLFLYACLRFHPSDKNSTSLNFHTTGASEKKSIQGVPLPIHYFRNDFYSVTSSVAFERRFLELRFQQFDFTVSVPVESSS